MPSTSMFPRPLLLLLPLVLTGSLALGQAAAPAPAPPANPPGSPAQGQPQPGAGRDMHPGMGQGMQGGQYGHESFRGSASTHRSGSDYHGGRGGFAGDRGGFGSEAMGGAFHIAPAGMWWKNPGIVQKLSLSADQTRKMDDIFQASRIQLIDLHANVEKQNVILEPMLSANPPDTAKAMAQIDKVAQARADLEKADARMLLGIRGVLTPDQWTKLHTPTPRAAQPGAGGGAPARPGGARNYAPDGQGGPRAGGGYAGGRGSFSADRGNGPAGQGNSTTAPGQ